MIRTVSGPFLAAALVVAGGVGQANAAFVTFFDKSDFLAATGATHVVEPYVQFSPGRWAGWPEFGHWSSRLEGNHQIAQSGWENLNVALASPVYSFGFEFVEPQFDPLVNAPFVDSTFQVTLLNQATKVASFTFNAPNDLAYFVGAQSDLAFNKVEILEIVGNIDNEFYGQFFASTGEPSSSVPEPASVALLGLGLTGLTVVAARRRRV